MAEPAERPAADPRQTVDRVDMRPETEAPPTIQAPEERPPEERATGVFRFFTLQVRVFLAAVILGLIFLAIIILLATW